MVKNCFIKSCKRECYPGCGLSFHRLPTNEEIKQKWLDVIPLSQKITKNSVVCSLHFHLADFLNPIQCSRRVLNVNAVPSIFPVVKIKQELGKPELSEPDLSEPDLSEPELSESEPLLQSISNKTPSTSQESNSEASSRSPSPNSSDQTSENKFYSNCKDVAVQTEICRYNSPKENDLRRKVKILSLRLKRRDAKLKKFKVIMAILKKHKHSTDEIQHMIKTILST